MEIRQAFESDIEAIAAFDHVAEMDEARTEFIARSVGCGSVWVAVVGGRIAGYVPVRPKAAK